MKVTAFIIVMILVGGYIDHQYYGGRYFRALSMMSQQIVVHFGLR
jgi:hypothetical protein